MRFINDHLYPLCAALLFTVGISAWFALPPPLQPKTTTPVPEAWQLPAPASVAGVQAVQNIIARNLWGTPQDKANAAPPAPKWSVMGIARNGTERFVLLAYENQAITQLKVGDALPDGMKIAQIEDDRFFVLTANKKKIAFGMYKNEPTK